MILRSSCALKQNEEEIVVLHLPTCISVNWHWSCAATPTQALNSRNGVF